MVQLTFNDLPQAVASVEALGLALDRFDAAPRFELWISVPSGPSMCMLRNGDRAWLMYLRENGDSGFVSLGDPKRNGVEHYTLSNGQVDEYPLAWCIDLEQCYKAIAYFFVNEGARPDWLTWKGSDAPVS